MTAKPLLPDIWVAKKGGGIEPLDLTTNAHLDLEPDDDDEPTVFPPDVADMLGFDPLEEHQITGDTSSDKDKE